MQGGGFGLLFIWAEKPEVYRTAPLDSARQQKINVIIIEGERINLLPLVHASQNTQVYL